MKRVFDEVKLFMRKQDKVELMSETLIDEAEYYKIIKKKKEDGWRQVIFSDSIMKMLLEEYFITEEYSIEMIFSSNPDDTRKYNSIILKIKEDGRYFYKLWECDFEDVNQIVMKKEDEIFFAKANGIYSASQEETVHNIVKKYFNETEKESV